MRLVNGFLLNRWSVPIKYSVDHWKWHLNVGFTNLWTLVLLGVGWRTYDKTMNKRLELVSGGSWLFWNIPEVIAHIFVLSSPSLLVGTTPLPKLPIWMVDYHELQICRGKWFLTRELLLVCLYFRLQCNLSWSTHLTLTNTTPADISATQHKALTTWVPSVYGSPTMAIPL